MPTGWSTVFSDDQKTCASIDGDYQNLGLGNTEKKGTLEVVRLDVALGHTFPSNKMPDRVSVLVDNGSNLLNLHFGHPVNLDFSETMNCLDGWYVFEQNQSDQYVGDGTKLDYLLRKIRLAKGRDGSLIIHLLLERQFSSLTVLKSRELTESWSRYEVYE